MDKYTTSKYLVIVEPVKKVAELVKTAYSMNIPLILLVPFENDVPIFEQMVPNARVINIKNDSIDEWIKLLPPVDKIGGVLAGNEISVDRAAKLAERLKKGRYTLYEDAICCRYKDEMRKRLKSKNVANPKFVIIKNKSEIEEATKEIGFPCIVKPVDQSGSVNVTLVNSNDEVEAAFDRIKSVSIFDYVYKPEEILIPRKEEVIIEEYMTGQEFSIESFVRNGEVIFSSVTEKKTTHAPYFIEIGHHNPTLNYSNIENEIKEFGKTVLDALGIREGVAHCEVILTKDGLKVIECANRCGGDNIMNLIKNSYGIDFYKSLILNSLDMDPEIEITQNNSSAIRFFYSNNDKKVNDIYFEEFNDSLAENVVECNLFIKKGDKINAVKNLFDRFGYVICKGKHQPRQMRE